MNPADLFYFSIPFWIPAVVGLYLFINRSTDLGLMAALMTLKPIVATPIWIAILEGFYISTRTLEPVHFLTLLPGAGLTIIIAFIFRPLFFGPKAKTARILLGLDCARWLNSFLLILPYGNSPDIGGLRCIFALIGLALPTVFAVVALTTVLTGSKAQSGQQASINLDGEL